MPTRRASARTSARPCGNNGFRLDRAEITLDDLSWLASAERLDLRNVKVPSRLLARLNKLWWLSLSGGSASDLQLARGATGLNYLGVNQVRGMRDLSCLRELVDLRYLDLYGLPRVPKLPSLRAHTQLEHVRLGQMRGLLSLRELLQAPNLRELELVGRVHISDDDVERIASHATIQRFGWFAEDVPVKVWEPVVNRIGLPKVPHLHPEEWFAMAKPSHA